VEQVDYTTSHKDTVDSKVHITLPSYDNGDIEKEGRRISETRREGKTANNGRPFSTV